jgi:hypothetical protein
MNDFTRRLASVGGCAEGRGPLVAAASGQPYTAAVRRSSAGHQANLEGIRMRRILALAICALALSSGAALAANPPGPPGQPNQNCGTLKATTPIPLTDPNSAFTVIAAAVYANGQLPNPTAVSQYDVACFQTSQTHP